MELPKGVFWIRAAGGMPESYILSLVRIAESLYREIVILTDIPVTTQGDGNKVTINGDLSGTYHYLFATDGRNAIGSVTDRLFPYIASRGWKCWTPPRSNVASGWDDARSEATTVLSTYHFDAVCIPNVAVDVGPDRDVIFSKSGVVSSVMCPNSGDGYWREIFRASNMFGAKANIQSVEM